MGAQRFPAPCTLLVLLPICLLLLATGELHAQPVHPGPGEWGDAPEGNVAYPSLGVTGMFPTLFADAGAGYIWHGTPNAWFGNSFDLENDGNGGFNLFPPYDADECYGPADTDGGLNNPAAYTIDLGLVTVACDSVSLMVPYLGPACGVVQPFAGTVFDLLVQNLSGNVAYINILFDWDQDGRWGGQSLCSNGNIAEEHAVVNLPVPDGYVGPIGGLGIPQVFIGPNSGYVWARFSIMNQMPSVPIGWDGSGEWDVGETEDYLLQVGGSSAVELGDAPEDQLAYPNGTVGAFPTCLSSSTAGVVQHLGVADAWFGPSVDFEVEGNANDCSFHQYDVDECDRAGGDAGLLLPDPFTINGASFEPCTVGNDQVLWKQCTRAVWGTDVDIEVFNGSADDRYVNVLADWDESGGWGGTQTCSPGLTSDEHVLVDFVVPTGFNGPLSLLNPPSFLVGGTQDYCWVRFSITDQPVGAGWDGSGTFGTGETEDYLVPVNPQVTGSTPATPLHAIQDLRSYPNPFNPRTTLRFTLSSAGELSVRVFDTAGRQVAELHRGPASAGEMQLSFEGVDDQGDPLPSGIYYAELSFGSERQTVKLLMLK